MSARTLAILMSLCAGLGLGSVAAQGFSGLGQPADGFAAPSRDTSLAFPRDHGAHEDFRIEWWYITANLTGSDGRDYGAQWTLFRTALAPGGGAHWQSPQIWLGHAALTTPDKHYAAERYGRGGVGQAGVEAAPFAAWIDNWEMSGPHLNNITVTAQAPDFRYNLDMKADRPFVLHGDDGFSVKSQDGEASHYYSQPFYTVSGTLETPDGAIAVTGQAWLDREWFSQILTGDQVGWDWIALHLDGGAKLMAFEVRRAGGQTYSEATWIDPGGHVTPYGDGAVRLTPLEVTGVAGREVPTRWRVAFPEKAVDVEISAVNPRAWMDLTVPYWEGPVRITGSHTGRGYLEMTGYE